MVPSNGKLIKRSDTKTVRAFLRDSPQLRVPRYQRGYSWQPKHIDDFIADWREVASDDGTYGSNHFLGGLVVIDRVEPTHYEIVDGQQRLTTLFLAIFALIDSYERLKKQCEGIDSEVVNRANNMIHAANGGLNQLIRAEEVNNQGNMESLEQLRLSNIDREFFSELMDGQPHNSSVESHKLLSSALDQLVTRLFKPIVEGDLSLKEKFTQLSNLQAALLDLFYVLEIVSESREQAYKLFAVLNDRGQSLSAGDQLRWRSMELLDESPDLQKKVASYWDEILSGGPSETDSFLKTFYASHVKGRPKATDVAGDYTRWYLGGNHKSMTARDFETSLNRASELMVIRSNNVETDSDIERFVRSMRNSMKIFRLLKTGDWPYNDGTCENLWIADRQYRLVNVLKHTLCFQLLLSVRRNLTESEFTRLLLILERFVFRYITIMDGSASALEAIYNVHAYTAQSTGKLDIGKLTNDLGRLLQEQAPDGIFGERLHGSKLNFEKPVQRKVIAHFLTTIDDYYDSCNKANGTLRPDMTKVTDLKAVDIEHIYPQTAKLEDKNENLEEAKQRLGNLTYWAPGDNRSAKNNPFSMKKIRYKDSSARSTRRLASLKSWNISQLNTREKDLVSKALIIFRV